MDVEKLLQDGLLVVAKLSGDLLEAGCQLSVVGLLCQLIGPVAGDEVVGAAVVDLACLAGRGTALVEEGLDGAVQGVAQDAGAGVVVLVLLVAEGLGQGEVCLLYTSDADDE
mgnify:CR=1 FL=1